MKKKEEIAFVAFLAIYYTLILIMGISS